MTLIEVLVALLIFSFGLLGFVGLQVRATQFSVGAENSNRAALLANEMVAQIQLGGSPFAMPTAAAVAAWQARVSAAGGVGLPGATGTVVPTSAGNGATITVTWLASGTAADVRARPQNRYVTQVVVP